MKAYRKFIIALIFILAVNSPSYSEKFVPMQPIIKASKLKAGSTGYILTVLKGTKPSRLPVKIISAVPQRPGRTITNEILIKFTGGHQLSKGMSGSPVYINGKLAGAVRSGWDLSDHSLAMITPIESMCAIFDYESESKHDPRKNFLAGDLILTGINKTPALQRLADSLGLGLVQGVSMSSGGLNISRETLKPGDAVSALLVWGDFELSASGTVTATSHDGRFIAFGHSFMKRGAVNFPAAKTFVHDTVGSVSFPFKLTSPIAINGTITQDRESGIGGMFGYYAPSIAGRFIFKDLDSNTTQNFNFRVIADEFFTQTLLEGIFTGLAEEAWDRKGQGTMQITTHIDGRNIPYGWSRKDIFYESENIIAKVTDLIVKMKDDNHIVHGDIHMKNVLVENGKMILIDMETLSTGNAVFDLQGLYIAYRCYDEDEPDNCERFLGLSDERCDFIWKNILSCYFYGCSKEEIREYEKRIQVLAYFFFIYKVAVTKMSRPDLINIRVEHSTEKLRKLLGEVGTLEI